jgi:tRNA-modifying protein YgfZ
MTAIFRPEEGALLDLSARAKFRIVGADRFRFLNGQITNDLRKASASAAIEACMLSAKGKTNAHVFISESDAGFQLDAESELREALTARLDRYIIADDVQLEDITERFAMFHVIGETLPTLPGEWRAIRAATRLGRTGWDFWIDMAEHDAASQKLSAIFPFLNDIDAETFRIEMGVPRWGRELTEEIIPVEANLETRAIDYEKGCYIGQEVISRMKMSGQTNKRLCGIVSLAEEPLAVGMRLILPGEEKEVGWITSVTHSERLQKEIALGFVKRGANSIGTRLEARRSPKSDAVREIFVAIAALPFI